MDFKDITIEQFQYCYKLLKIDKSLDTWLSVLNYLTGNTIEHYEGLPIKELQNEITQLQWMLQPESITHYKEVVTIDNKIYKGLSDISKGTYGQYASIKTILGKGDAIENIHMLLGTIYAPIKLFGLKYDSLQVAEEMKKAKALEVIGLVFFYSKISKRLMPIINDYLAEAAQLLASTEKSLVEPMSGI